MKGGRKKKGSAKSVGGIVESNVDKKAEFLHHSVDDIVEHLKECAEGMSGLDIYQMTAYYASNGSTVQYLRSAMMSILVVTTQLITAFFIFWQGLTITIAKQIEDDTMCHGTDSVWLRMMNVLFAITICFYSVSCWDAFRHYGMYRINLNDFSNKPDFLSTGWITFGYVCNTVVMCISLPGAVFVVWQLPLAIDIVINGAGVFFLMNLDDLFITAADYHRFKEFLTFNEHQEPFEISTTHKAVNYGIHYSLIALTLVVFAGSFLFNIVIMMCPIN